MYTSTAVLTLAMAAFSFALPNELKRQSSCILDTVSQPDTDQVDASIVQWNSDVDGVNSFLDTAFSLSTEDLHTAVLSALVNANDEPCQLSTLSSIPGIDTNAFTCAVSDLGDPTTGVFGAHVITNLNTIRDSTADTAAVHTAVNDINLFRCCHVLPDADILWRDSAEDSGIFGSVQTMANRPNACASIDCSGTTPVCGTLDNGSSGK